MIRPLTIVLALALAGCAHEYGYVKHYYVNEVEVSETEYDRIYVECEKKSGGANYPAAQAACRREAGLAIKHKPAFIKRID